jgi:hypothetical protein
MILFFTKICPVMYATIAVTAIPARYHTKPNGFSPFVYTIENKLEHENQIKT